MRAEGALDMQRILIDVNSKPAVLDQISTERVNLTPPARFWKHSEADIPVAQIGGSPHSAVKHHKSLCFMRNVTSGPQACEGLQLDESTLLDCQITHGNAP